VNKKSNCRKFHCAAINQNYAARASNRAILRRAQGRNDSLTPVMAPLMLGVMFVLEVVWIFFLMYAVGRLVLPGR
jgi:hypothetical protein